MVDADPICTRRSEDPTATSWSSEVVMLGLPFCIDITTVESDEGATAALQPPRYRTAGFPQRDASVARGRTRLG